MILEAQILSAIEAGILDEKNAQALKTHVLQAGTKLSTQIDKEHFQLVTGFSDVFCRHRQPAFTHAY